MNNKQKTTGLLALIGIAGGALAYWKYRNLSPEEKAKLKERVNEVGDKVKDTYNEVGTKVKETYTDVEETISEKYAKLKDLQKKNTEKIAS